MATLIFAGLGNQLFQFAAGLALASRLNAELYIDRTPATRGRPYLLDRFGLPLKAWRHGPPRDNATSLLEEKDVFEDLDEYGSTFEPQFFNLKAPCYLRGYFQSWRYLQGYEDAISSALDPSILRSWRTSRIERHITSSVRSVAVHVRRGDYANEPEKFRLIGREYYDRARTALGAAGNDAVYYLFSDDLSAALELLRGWENLVPVAPLSALEHFHLMTSCDDFIIANSTFSWWAAWLGSCSTKVVVAPRRWYGPGFTRKFNPDDLLPPAWIQVDE